MTDDTIAVTTHTVRGASRLCVSARDSDVSTIRASELTAAAIDHVDADPAEFSEGEIVAEVPVAELEGGA